jgi:hypothetical protein
MVPKKFILLALVAAFPALANTLKVGDVDHSLGMGSLWIHEDQLFGLPLNTGGSNQQIYWAGAITISVDQYVRQVFCVQLFTDIYLGGTYSTTMNFSDTPNLERLGWLLQNHFPTTALQGAAFQLAFWDIIEDNGDGFAPGAGKITEATDSTNTSIDLVNPTDAGVLAQAQLYEALSLGHTAVYGVVYHNTTFDIPPVPVQNLIGGPVTDEGPSPAPEPATVFMMLAGGVLIGLSRLRRGARTN